ncbi:MAG: RNA polymerase sigma factor [Blastocatellia bacterium]
MRLVAEVIRKDRKATADFVACYADCIYSYVRKRITPHQDAVDDLVQEVFLGAWQSLNSFRGDATLRSWLLGIARHKVQDYYRRRLREVEWPFDGEDSLEEPTITPLLEERLDRELTRDRLYRVLASLPERYSLALMWRYLENRSVREIAEATGKTEKAVERLLARSRDQFKREWDHAAK